ncbi:MAG TPA: hypothetical protein VHY08_22595 [Bacillota bacterium]|nr:hypothetical protein [Bacillota bacterium]
MKTKLGIALVIAALLLSLSIPVYAVSDDSQLQIQSYLRLWGIDLQFIYQGLQFINGVDTNLWISAGGGAETIGFYRESDDSLYTPPLTGTDLGIFNRTNFLGTLGLSQGLIYDEANQRNLLELMFYYRSSSETYTKLNGVNAKIFETTLPDRDGITQNSALVGIVYKGIAIDPDTQVRQGVYAEASYESAPKSLNDIADYTRLNTTAIGFWPLVQSETYCLFLGDRMMYDKLDGAYIPINARSSFGGASVFPGITSLGLGGTIRGVGPGRFDGYDKLINNLDLRMTFPELIGGGWMTPGVIVYYDFGYTDNLTHELDLDQMKSSAGLSLFAHLKLPLVELDLGVSNDYFINENRSTLNLLAYLQF